MKDKYKTLAVGADLHETIRQKAFKARVSIRVFVTRAVQEWIASQKKGA